MSSNQIALKNVVSMETLTNEEVLSLINVAFLLSQIFRMHKIIG